MNLLELQDASLVEKTNLTRKLTLGGVTKAYPVYRVRLDLLYYNDQNDRIATWITQYKSDPENAAFDTLDREQYNKTIEGFIIASNPAAMEKTKNNIALVNQREPGVVLADGRIIDGNRRFTCLLFYIFLILFISASQQFRIFTVTGKYPSQPTSLMGYFLSSQFSLRTCL